MARAKRGPVKGTTHYVVLNWLAPIARHPLATTVTGVGLLFSGVMELVEDLVTDFMTARPGLSRRAVGRRSCHLQRR
jgi:hypothetical protein